MFDRKRWPFYVTLVFLSYSVLLLWSSLRSDSQLRAAADARLLADSKRAAVALADFGEDKRRTVMDLARLHEIDTYLVNQALGMSMRYGLNASLEAIELRFRARTQDEESSSASAGSSETRSLSRIVLFDENGEVLADSAGSAASGVTPDEAPPAPARAPFSEPQVLIEPDAGRIVARAPVNFKGAWRGSVVMVSDLSLVRGLLINLGAGGSYRETLLTAQNVEIVPSGAQPHFTELMARVLGAIDVSRPVDLSEMAAASGTPLADAVAVRADIEPLGASLVTTMNKSELYGALSSRVSLVSLSLFPLLLLVAYRQLERTRSALAKSNKELQQVLEELRTAQAKVLDQNAELERAHRTLEEIAITDTLTGLRNRRFLLQTLDNDVALATRTYEDWAAGRDSRGNNVDLTFFLVDIDHFKQINDRFGHAAGDAVLQQMRERLVAAVRESDYLVRWGGEEFLVVARESDRDQAGVVAERIRASIGSRPFPIPGGDPLAVTGSVGFASFPFVRGDPQRVNWQDVVNVADSALYLAKRNGRDAWVGITASRDGGYERVDGLAARISSDPAAALASNAIRVHSSRQLMLAPVAA